MQAAESRIAELFRGVRSLDVQPRNFVFRYRSAENWFDTFRDFYGPTLKAFAALDAEARVAFEHDLLALAHEHNSSRTGALRIESEYLEVVVSTAG